MDVQEREWPSSHSGNWWVAVMTTWTVVSESVRSVSLKMRASRVQGSRTVLRIRKDHSRCEGKTNDITQPCKSRATFSDK